MSDTIPKYYLATLHKKNSEPVQYVNRVYRSDAIHQHQNHPISNLREKAFRDQFTIMGYQEISFEEFDLFNKITHGS
jgi:hypothetical protein